jgi:photosystem II stability/assembly factor-like uncharacterized protein
VPCEPPVLCGPSDTSIRAMTIDCYHPKRMMAGGRKRACLLESEDGGRTWTEQPALDGREIWSLHLHDGVGFAGTGPPAVYHYHDGRWHEFGAVRDLPSRDRWSFLHGDPPHVVTLTASGAFIMAGIEMGGVIRSRDGGATWEPSGEGVVNEDVHRLFADHEDPNHLFLGAADGLYETRDGGDQWTHVSGSEGLYVHGIAAHPKERRTLYLQARGGPLLRWKIGGAFERIGRELPMPDFGVDALDVDHAEPETLYYGAGEFIYRSSDGGASWEEWVADLPNIRRLRVFLA